ncbi:MAG: ASCH domain-containing protein [Armatimonadota bacterium]
MKALSVKQPAANKIASGEKTVELRTWPTKYRGPVLIVSSKRPDIEPAGCALAIVDIADCQPMRQEHVASACCGQLYPECFAWILTNVQKIKPFPMRGSLGLYEVDIDQFSLDNNDRLKIKDRLTKCAVNLAFDIE